MFGDKALKASKMRFSFHDLRRVLSLTVEVGYIRK